MYWPEDIFPTRQSIKWELLCEAAFVIVKDGSSSPIINHYVGILSVVNALAQEKFDNFALKFGRCLDLGHVRRLFEISEVEETVHHHCRGDIIFGMSRQVIFNFIFGEFRSSTIASEEPFQLVTVMGI